MELGVSPLNYGDNQVLWRCLQSGIWLYIIFKKKKPKQEKFWNHVGVVKHLFPFLKLF